jgi:adenylate cyclase
VRDPRRSRLLRLWTVGGVASLLVTGVSALGWLEPLQVRAQDLLLALRGQTTAGGIVLVEIDDEAFARLGYRQPLPREYLARVVRALGRSGAAVVGLDVSLATPTTLAEDSALAGAIRELASDGVSRVVLAETRTPDGGPLADPALRQAVVRGAADVPFDRDGVIRRAAFAIARGAGPPSPAFSLAIVGRLGGMDQAALDAAVSGATGPPPLPAWRRDGVGAEDPAPVPLRAGELVRINFVGPARSFLTVPSDAVAALAAPAAEVAEDNPFRGRVVLVGGTFRESREFYPTPFGPMAGVEVHANLVHMLATRSFVRPARWGLGVALQLALVGLAGLAFLWLRPLAGTLVSVGAALAIAVPASYWVFHAQGHSVDFVLPVLTTCLMGAGTEWLARRRLRQAFGRYVSPEVLTRVLADAPSLRGERRRVTMLCSDLRGFTALAEDRPAEAVAAQLSEYFDAMTRAILAHRGMVNDFVGDAIMATFGAPVADPDHAGHAVESAVAMERALAELNRRWETAGVPALRMGVAVHTGEVFVGNVGGPVHLKYAVVGDPVNVAARLESLNKDLGTTILVSEETRTALGDRVTVRDCGTIPVRGRTQPLRVYEVLDAARQEGRPAMRTRVAILGVVAWLVGSGLAWAADPVAVLTEIRPGQGEVRVKLAGETDWKAPRPLLALRPGDQVRVLGDGQAVLVFTGGQAAQVVTQANSPFAVLAPRPASGAERVRGLLGSLTEFLLGQQSEPAYRPLTTRTVRQRPVIVSPRETRLLPGPVRLEWQGTDHLRYRIRVVGPRGTVWEQGDLPRQPYEYPAVAPPLDPGVRYAWELEARGHPPQQAAFELLSTAEADRVRADLALLQPGALAGVPRNTVVVLRAGHLFQEGLYHEARRELLAGIAADPDEPTLHQLLGWVYERTGLPDLAAEAFAEAQFLSTRAP